jgi:hypothetical protein
MPEFMNVPVLVLFSTPPLAACVAALAYAVAPRLRRDVALRKVLIASVVLTAAEAVALLLLVGLFVLFGASGGLEAL